LHFAYMTMNNIVTCLLPSIPCVQKILFWTSEARCKMKKVNYTDYIIIWELTNKILNQYLGWEKKSKYFPFNIIIWLNFTFPMIDIAIWTHGIEMLLWWCYFASCLSIIINSISDLNHFFVLNDLNMLLRCLYIWNR